MATFEVVLLDNYAIIDSAKRLELIGRLRAFSDVPHSELPDSDLSTYLWSAAMLINPQIEFWDQINKIEDHAIILWSAIAITDFRMMSSAKYFPIDSRVGKTDPSKRVSNNVQIKQQLMRQFEDYLEQAGIILGDEGTIIQGELIRRNILTDANNPEDVQDPPPRPTLQFLGSSANTIDVQWFLPKISDFNEYIVYIDTRPYMEAPALIGVTADGKPGLRQDVTEVYRTCNQWEIASRITGLDPLTTYFVLVGAVDMNGRVTYSKEIQATTK